MKCLAVGGSGYVGGFLVDHLDAAGMEVTVYDSLLYEERYLKQIDFIRGDVRDCEKLSKIVKNYDVVIWLAAIVGDGACAANPELTRQVNVDSVKWLVENYKGRIIYPSTCSVFGLHDGLLTEDGPTNPQSLYAKTKLEAEKLIRDNCKDYLVFRLGTLCGISDAHARIRLDLVVNVLTKKAVQGEVLTVNGGEQWRPLLHVKDVALAVYFGLRNNIKGLYNLCDRNYKIHEIADKIGEIIPGTTVNHVDMKFEDLRNYQVDGSRFKRYGWKPEFNLEFGIREIETVIRENRIKNLNSPTYSNAEYMIKEKNQNELAR